MAPTYKDADNRFGSRVRDYSHNLDPSVINAKNAEIYLHNGNEKPKRSTASKRRKTVRNMLSSKLSTNKSKDASTDSKPNQENIASTYGTNEKK